MGEFLLQPPSPELPSADDRDGYALAASRRLVEGLRQASCYPHPSSPVEIVETHLSWVLLTGSFAYKIKKPLNLGFADFSTLARRHYFCEQELRLNQRLAPQLYREVVTITGSPEAPRINGAGPVLDYAVRMAQFPQACIAARLLQDQRLRPHHLDALAVDLAAFHERSPRAATGPRGQPEALHASARDNLAVLREMRGLGCDRTLATLARWSESRFSALAAVLRRRREAGCVRECHGDLHLGNMALLEDRLVMFDCIEFNSELRWTDTAAEVAFVVMDLLQRGAAPFARRFLNRYLEASADYGLLQTLDYFLVYRALVRAKVAALRALQCERPASRDAALAEARSYVALARGLTRRRAPALLITHGPSASGKTTVTQVLIDELGVIRVRSDVERKRLAGLAPAARTGSGLGQGIYRPDATARTYAALEERAAAIVQAGFSAVVDATFLQRAQRERFATLARKLGCPFGIVALHASAPVLQQRLAARQSAGADASEATPAVLQAQLQACEPLASDELGHALVLETGGADGSVTGAVRQWLARLPRLDPRPH